MFNKTPKLSEAAKTQIVIDYLVGEVAMRESHAPDTDSTDDIRMMLTIQRRKLKILNKKFNRKK